MDGDRDQRILTSTNSSYSDQTEIVGVVRTDINDLDTDDEEEYPSGNHGSPDAGALHKMSSDDQDRRTTYPVQVPRTSRTWSEAHASLAIMSVVAAAGLLVMCVPFLPRKHSAKTFLAILYILRNIAVTLLVVSALIGMVWLTLKVAQLHEQGLVLWPRRCRHCLEVFILIKFPDKTISEDSTSSVRWMSNLSGKELVENCATVSNVTLNIAYIFSGLVLLFMIPNIAIVCWCFNEHSPHNPTAETNSELIIQCFVILSLFMFVYIISFYFVPTFYDAHFVAVPKMCRSFLLLIQVTIWIAIQKLVRPFAILANGGNRTSYPCPLNSTMGEILKGALDISQPFSVELPVMLACLLIEMWSQHLPERVQSLANKNRRPRKGMKRRSNWTTLSNFCNNILKTRTPTKNKSEQSLLLTNDIEMEFVGFMDVHRGDSGCRTNNNLIPKPYPSNSKSTRTLRKHTEMALSITSLICIIYFGISNFLVAGHSELRGRYLQWLLRIAFFTPELMVIVKQIKMTRKGASGYLARRPERSYHGPSNKNNTMLLVTLSGACLFDMFRFVSGLGNLLSDPELSHDEMVLNMVSIFISVFGLLCKCSQTTFILRVEHQQPGDHCGMKWTLLCLLSVGMTNATQWLFDSLIHEEASSVAWPVLSMFFEGDVGLVMGMLFVPFLHLYELHIAIMAYEIYKHFWDVKTG